MRDDHNATIDWTLWHAFNNARTTNLFPWHIIWMFVCHISNRISHFEIILNGVLLEFAGKRISFDVKCRNRINFQLNSSYFVDGGEWVREMEYWNELTLNISSPRFTGMISCLVRFFNQLTSRPIDWLLNSVHEYLCSLSLQIVCMWNLKCFEH